MEVFQPAGEDWFSRIVFTNDCEGAVMNVRIFGAMLMAIVVLLGGNTMGQTVSNRDNPAVPSPAPTALASDTKPTDAGAALREALPTAGSLMIIGGGARHDNHALWSDFARLAGGPQKRVAVFPCASGYPKKNGERAAKMLQGYGLDAFLVPLAVSGLEGLLHEEVARDPQWLERVRQADGVYFIGGSQGRIRDALVDNNGRATPMLDAIWEVYRRGGVIAGTSAGAAVMSRVMFRDPAPILQNLQHGVRMGKDLGDGLGFLDANWFVDQHCLVRGRFARVLVAMSQHGMKYGVGIDEDTAVVVERGQRARIVGNRGAVVIDLSQAKHGATNNAANNAANNATNAPSLGNRAGPGPRVSNPDSRRGDEPGPFMLVNARLTYLNHGDAIDLRTLEVMPSATKRAERKIDPRAADFRPSLSRKLFYTDVLANTTLVDILTRVMVHKDGVAIGLAFDGAAAAEGPTPGFEFRFYRGTDSVGWETEAHGPTDSTIQNIHLDVRPVTIQGPLYRPATAEPTG
jgi:cyanophycinase